MVFTAGKSFTAQPKPPTDSRTAAIMAVDSIATSTGVNMDNLKIIGFLLNKFRERLMMIAGTNPTAAPMAEVDGAIDALKSHALSLTSTMKATPMKERMLALEKAVTKSHEEPVRKMAPLSTQGMGGRRTYALVVAPPATKAAVRIRVEGADKIQPAELLNKAKIHIEAAYAVRQLRRKDTEVFVQSISQRDAALNMAQPKDFCVLKQDYPYETLGVPLGTMI